MRTVARCVGSVFRISSCIERPQTFEEGGYSGVIMPAPRGVLAVLGQGVLVENVAARVLAAVDYGA
jgi:hypothetical protein